MLSVFTALSTSVGLADRAASKVSESRLTLPSLAKLMPIDPAVVYVLLPDIFSSRVFTIVFFMVKRLAFPMSTFDVDELEEEELTVF